MSRSKASTPSRRKPKFAPVTLSEQEGVRYLHFGTEWVQGAMRLRKPDWIELEYAQQMMAWMLFIEQPSRIVQLGLGTAALTKFCRRWYPKSLVTAVELNPAVIDTCHSMFKLAPQDEMFNIIEGDAMEFVLGNLFYRAIEVLSDVRYPPNAVTPRIISRTYYKAIA